MKGIWESTGKMGASKVNKIIGVIAEDQSDVDVIKELFEKYTAKKNFSVKKFVGNGCGKLRSKCAEWTKNLIKSGCHHVILFHDLDRSNETTLRTMLEKKVSTTNFPTSIIIIPTEELEAWLLTDELAIQKAFSLTKLPKKITDCEMITSPKEKIRDIAWSERKRYLTTVHNAKIAKHINLSNMRRCKSFATLDEYLTEKVFV